MGSCLVKSKIRKNSVSPSYSEAEIRKRNSRNLPERKAPDPINPEDMVKQLEEAEIEESKLTKGVVSFTVDFNTGDPSRMPSRLADTIDGNVTPNDVDDNEVHYTAAEKELMAELMREDILREKSVKARRDVQLYDAARRRAAYNT